MMATVKGLERTRPQGVRPLRVADIRAAVVTWLRKEWAARVTRPWLAVVAVPLAMLAAVLVGLWWTWLPLLVGAWWWSPGSRWTWVVACEEAIVGALWAYTGAINLASLPSHRLVVGTVWASFAGAVALSRVRRQDRARRVMNERR
jgi:hypothetical protein